MPDDRKEGEKLIPRSIKVELSLWEAARRKAGHIGLSEVVRRFLRKWVKGEIDIDLED